MGLAAFAAFSMKDTFTPAKQPGYTPPPTPDPVQDEKDAQKSAKKRRDLYANVGRSSTILTGPGGIQAAPADSTAPKQLLGL